MMLNDNMSIVYGIDFSQKQDFQKTIIKDAFYSMIT